MACGLTVTKDLKNELIYLYYDFITHFERKINIEKEYKTLLKTNENLRKRLNQKLGLTSVAPVEIDVKVTTVAEFNPLYLEYVKIYGFPIGGIFEADKLAALMSDKPVVEKAKGIVSTFERSVEEIYDINIESSYDGDGDDD